MGKRSRRTQEKAPPADAPPRTRAGDWQQPRRQRPGREASLRAAAPTCPSGPGQRCSPFSLSAAPPPTPTLACPPARHTHGRSRAAARARGRWCSRLAPGAPRQQRSSSGGRTSRSRWWRRACRSARGTGSPRSTCRARPSSRGSTRRPVPPPAAPARRPSATPSSNPAGCSAATRRPWRPALPSAQASSEPAGSLWTIGGGAHMGKVKGWAGTPCRRAGEGRRDARRGLRRRLLLSLQGSPSPGRRPRRRHRQACLCFPRPRAGSGKSCIPNNNTHTPAKQGPGTSGKRAPLFPGPRRGTWRPLVAKTSASNSLQTQPSWRLLRTRSDIIEQKSDIRSRGWPDSLCSQIETL